MEEPPPSTHAEDATTPGPDRDEEAEDISDEIHQQIEGKDSPTAAIVNPQTIVMD